MTVMIGLKARWEYNVKSDGMITSRVIYVPISESVLKICRVGERRKWDEKML